MTELYCERTLLLLDDCDCEDCVERRRQGELDSYVEHKAESKRERKAEG